MTEGQRPRPRLLFADDSRVLRMSAEKILAPDFELVLVDDGEQAWERLKSDSSILAVFTDLGMPVLDGYGLLERIRGAEEPHIRELPVIVVTGNEEASARDQALERGATDFITKPFERAELLARARTHATSRHMRERADLLERSSTEDPVTGVGNRRHFQHRLREERASSLRQGKPVSLMGVDVHDFDRLMAEHGKRAIARLLHEVAAQLRDQVREEDVVARLVAGRFGLICPDCDSTGASALAGRLLTRIAAKPLGGDARIPVRLDIGIICPPRDPALTLDRIFQDLRTAVGQAAVAEVPTPVVFGETVDTEVPGLDRALRMLEKKGGAEQLAPHFETLLSRCVKIFEAAPRRIAVKNLGFLARRLGLAKPDK
jgi:two-component system, cell cycle response regulator